MASHTGFEVSQSPLDEVMEKIGVRKFHMYTLFMCGMGYFASGAEFTLPLFIAKVASGFANVRLSPAALIASSFLRSGAMRRPGGAPVAAFAPGPSASALGAKALHSAAVIRGCGTRAWRTPQSAARFSNQ